jgi:hypothetical protein
LKLIAEFGSIEGMSSEIRDALGPMLHDIREIFLKTNVTAEYEIQFTPPDIDGIFRFLCDEREFSRERVAAALERTFGQPRST